MGDYFTEIWLLLSTQMNNCIHGYAPDHLVNSIEMACDINDVNTWNSCTMNTHIPYCRTDILKMLFIYCGSVLWNDLPNDIQESLTLDHFKRQAKLLFSSLTKKMFKFM